MSKEFATIKTDDASSSTSYDTEPRTTLTGKPITYQHDNVTSIMMSHGGGFGAAGSAGVNLLPPGYTDDSLVNIPIKVSDFADDPNPEVKQSKKKSLLNRIKSGHSDVEVKVVVMSRGDYLKYWAKGDDGQFLPTVVEPPEGRAEWIKKQMLQPENQREAPPVKYQLDPVAIVGAIGGAGC